MAYGAVARTRLATLEDKATIDRVPFEEVCPHRSITEMLEEVCAERADKPAITFQLKGGPKERLFVKNYDALWKDVVGFANALFKLGVKPGDTVAILMPNLPETAVAFLAAQAIGVALPINPLLDAEAIGGILERSGAKALVTLRPFLKTDIAQKAAQAVWLAPNVRTVIEADLLPYISGPMKPIASLFRPKHKDGSSARMVNYHRELASAPNDRFLFERTVGLDDIGAYFTTGGTTGAPKLAKHTHRGMLANSWVVKNVVVGEDDVALMCLPLFHVFASYVLLLGPLAAGAHVVMATPAGFRGDGVIDNFWKLVERHKASFLAAVPTALAALDQRPVDADVSTLSYLISGSAPLPTALFRRFEQNTGVKILEGYGMTEATCVASCNPPDGETRIGSVGLPIPFIRSRISKFDSDGKLIGHCATDEIGEICFQGDHVFAGYRDPARTAAVFHFDEGENRPWLRTGDLGRIDADGYIWITGRAKDLIIRGGHNIDPGLIEEALAEHPDVAFVGAVGQPDAYTGEMPCAYVELRPGSSATPEALKAFADRHVHERAARPAVVEILEELPKTAVGKIFKPDLRKRALARVYGDALTKAGLSATVAVVDDDKLGVCVEVTPQGAVDPAAIEAALGGFARPWRLAGA